MGPDIFIPLGFFATVVGIVWLVQYFATRKRIEAYQTLRLAIEKGQEVSAETMETLTRLGPPLADLRRGILFLAAAGAIAAMGWIFRDFGDEAMRGIMGVAMFPLFLGLAYVGLHIFANPKK